MTDSYQKLRDKLSSQSFHWLVTGAAGFIGSNLVETLLLLNQKVVGLDNLSLTGGQNFEDVRRRVSDTQWRNFTFLKGDIRNLADCRTACNDIDFVLHQAALGSVPRSLDDPIASNESNVSGFLNMLVAARDAKVKNFVYAASSSTYGDEATLPKKEDRIGKPLSPYAVTKLVNEIYANVFARCYGFETIGLRYFNVFGRRQDPLGAYAAVIPLWIHSLLNGSPVYINGDGETSRDFCYIDNVVQANLLAAMTDDPKAKNQVYNVAVGDRTTLNTVFQLLKENLEPYGVSPETKPVYREFRSGDVRHSQADVSKIQELLGYRYTHRIADGLAGSIPWYVSLLRNCEL
jgi:UDP-N-acetylglucosamine/UDP-N-acetylgalactosamine 4-epimerase